MVVEHPADGGGAGDPLGGGGADGGAVFEVAAAGVGGVPDPPVGALCAARVYVRGLVGGVAAGGRFGGRAGRRMVAARRGRVAGRGRVGGVRVGGVRVGGVRFRGSGWGPVVAVRRGRVAGRGRVGGARVSGRRFRGGVCRPLVMVVAGRGCLVGCGRVGGPRFRGSAAGGGAGLGLGVGEGFGADVDDDLVEVRISRGCDLPGQVIGCDPSQRIRQTHRLRTASHRTAHLRAARFRAVRVGPARMRTGRLRTDRLLAARSRAAPLRPARLRPARRRGAWLRAAGLRADRLRGAWLQTAPLRAVGLRGARFRAARFRAARLRGTWLQTAPLRAVRRRGAGRCARRFRGGAVIMAGTVRMVEVSRGGAERLDQDLALHRGQADRHRDPPVLVIDPPGHPPRRAGPLIDMTGDLPVRAGEPVQLPAGHRLGQLGQAFLGGRGGDPGQGPDFRIRQPPGGEPGPDHGQVPQGAGDPDLLAGGAGCQLALPRQLRRTRRQLPRLPPPPRIKVADQEQEPAGRRGQMPGQLADLRLQALQRHLGGRAGLVAQR